MTEPEIINRPKHLRRICWYSLAVVVLSVIGLLAYGSWRSEKQRAAIAEIERGGGVSNPVVSGGRGMDVVGLELA